MFIGIRRLLVVIVSVLFIGSGLVHASDFILASWNVKRLGHGSNQDIESLAEVAQRFDLIALQEVMTVSGLERFTRELEKSTRESWSSIASHALGNSSYKEHYAFIWKDSVLEYEEGAVVYIDKGEMFSRQPFSAKFRSKRDGSTLAVGNVHVVYGNRVSDRVPEITALGEYWHWLKDIYAGSPVILVGDFNLSPEHPAWTNLKVNARPLIINGATTLSSVDGRYANLYDNIWVENDSRIAVSESGILDYPRILKLDHKTSRARVSDHAPVYAVLGRASLNGANPTEYPKDIQTFWAPPPGAVRGNKSTNIYHFPNCPSYNRISEYNRVEFSDHEAAEVAGFRLAGNC